jgi:nucleoside-diphosphate-sugar epimerase
MRVFVAGATGVIGRALLPLLTREGHEVVGMTRSQERAALIRELGAEPAVADAFDADGLREAVAAARPEAVIHELTDIPRSIDPKRFAEQFERNNRLRREGTRNLMAAARAAGARRVVAQSIAFAYAPKGGGLRVEQDPLALDAGGPWGETVGAVAELERAVTGAGEVEGVVLRYGYFYGPGTYHPDEQAPPPAVHVETAARRTVEALGAPSGVITVVDDPKP